MNKIRKFKNSTMLPGIIVFVLVVLTNIFLQPSFFKGNNMKSNLLTFTPLILIAMAQAVIILSGAVDLSIGAGITLINVVMASVMKDSMGSIWLALVLCFSVSLMVNMVNAVCVAVLKLPAMVATFATASIWYGLALIIMPQPGGYVPSFFYRLYQKNVLWVFPIPLIVIVLALAIWYEIKRRPLYRHIIAVGNNEEGAYSNGIKVTKVKLAAFAISSVFMAFAGIVITAQVASGDANLGATLTLPSVAAGVIGGISLQGGRGKLEGAIIGAVILGLLTNVIFYANIPSLYQELIKGFIIILALAIGVIPSIKNQKNRV